MSRLLVCPPKYFQIDYEINPWMRRENAVVPSRAAAQWQALMKVLEEEVGAGIERMQPVPGLPDLVFTANAGVAICWDFRIRGLADTVSDRTSDHFRG